MDDLFIVDHDIKKIQILEGELRKSFTLKYLGPTKQIFGMKITYNRKNDKFWLS